MKNETRSEYLTCHSLLKLHSDHEVASVGTAETAARLSNGEECHHLQQLGQDVRRVQGTVTPMERVLPRKAVHENTWSKILTQLAARGIATAHSGA